MNSLLKYTNQIIKYVCATFLAIMVLMIFTNTVLRYFFNGSILSTEEVCRFLFVWGTFLAVITVWQEKGHIAVTTVTDKLKGKNLVYFKFICSFFTLFSFFAVVWGSYEYMQENSYYAQITGISYGFMIVPVLISGFVCLLITINDMAKVFVSNKETE